MTVQRLFAAVAALALLAACGGAASTTSAGPPLRPAGTASASGQAQAPASGPAKAQPGVPQTAPADQLLPVGPRIQRTARLDLELKHGGFDGGVARLFQIVQDEGGLLAGSTADGGSYGPRTGTFSFEIPQDKFLPAIDAVRKLGNVLHQTAGGNDVSAQYVDLQSRLKNAQAQRDAMLAILQQAKTVQDMIQIQNQLGSIEGQIEQIEGQLNYLDHTTTYSTLTVNVSEAPAAAVAGDEWGFQTALATAVHQFVATIDATIVVLGTVAPFLILLLLGGLAWRFRPGRPAKAAA